MAEDSDNALLPRGGGGLAPLVMVNPLGAINAANQAAQSEFQTREWQAKEAAGQAFQNSIDPNTGQPNQALLMQNLRNPRAALAAQDSAERGLKLDTGTYDLHNKRLTSLASGMGQLIADYPNGVPYDAATTLIEHRLQTGLITPQEAQQMRAILSQDPHANTQSILQGLLSNLNGQQALDAARPKTGTLDTGQGTIGTAATPQGSSRGTQGAISPVGTSIITGLPSVSKLLEQVDQPITDPAVAKALGVEVGQIMTIPMIQRLIQQGTLPLATGQTRPGAAQPPPVPPNYTPRPMGPGTYPARPGAQPPPAAPAVPPGVVVGAPGDTNPPPPPGSPAPAPAPAPAAPPPAPAAQPPPPPPPPVVRAPPSPPSRPLAGNVPPGTSPYVAAIIAGQQQAQFNALRGSQFAGPGVPSAPPIPSSYTPNTGFGDTLNAGQAVGAGTTPSGLAIGTPNALQQPQPGWGTAVGTYGPAGAAAVPSAAAPAPGATTPTGPGTTVPIPGSPYRGVVTSVPLGTGKGVDISVEHAGQARARALSYARDTQPIEAAIDNLRHATTGVGAETLNALRARVQDLAPSFVQQFLPASLTDPARRQAFEEANKYLTAMSLQVPGASRSDAGAKEGSAASPSVHISNAAAIEVGLAILAQRRLEHAAIMAFDKSGMSDAAHDKTVTAWMLKQDPRAFVADKMDGAERNAYVESIGGTGSAAYKRYKQSYIEAVDAGLIKR